MIIGLDFDNTIVCYDQAIKRLANRLFDLPMDLPRTKLALRDHLRELDREAEWTVFQGELYGPCMAYAEPFDNCIEVLETFKKLGFRMYIVSHRSRHPYAGPAYDLHSFARQWIDSHLVSRGLLKLSDVFFNETRIQKVEAIANLGCNIFFDDLPEVFKEHHFPQATISVLFDPQGEIQDETGFAIAKNWNEFPALINRIRG